MTVHLCHHKLIYINTILFPQHNEMQRQHSHHSQNFINVFIYTVLYVFKFIFFFCKVE